jgi:hypothetical protein
MSLQPLVLIVVAACGARADLGYPTRVATPAHVAAHPRLVIDEAHRNAHTRDGKYKPFANLAASDGFDVQAGRERFTAASLAGTRVLVIANPRGRPNKASPAFTDVECAAVEAWVRGGGALLLITDHVPIGAASKPLADRFGTDQGMGEVQDPVHRAVMVLRSTMVRSRDRCCAARGSAASHRGSSRTPASPSRSRSRPAPSRPSPGPRDPRSLSSPRRPGRLRGANTSVAARATGVAEVIP